MEKFQPIKKNFIPEKIVISIRLEEEKLEEIDKLSYENNISRNEFINQCITFALKNLANEEKKK